MSKVQIVGIVLLLLIIPAILIPLYFGWVTSMVDIATEVTAIVVATLLTSGMVLLFKDLIFGKKEPTAPPKVQSMSQDESPLVSLIGTTEDEVYEVIDETNKGPLVKDEGGIRTRIYGPLRRLRKNAKAEKQTSTSEESRKGDSAKN
jgi:hypothetical protein